MEDDEFIPASHYYGDKYARTMEEAFGPGAQLGDEPDEFDAATCLVLGALLAVGFIALCVLAGILAARW